MRSSMRPVLVYGLLGGVLITCLRAIEYRYLVLHHSADVYGALVALLFAGLGLWLGVTLDRRRVVTTPAEAQASRPAAPAGAPFTPDAGRLAAVGITRRELEILGLIADGLSNRDIAERLFVSENTVKTHASRVFDKLNARRRTQAVQIAKQLALIP